ncbi:hypothetical protein EXE46_08175 [Halorubrum sp. GN11_10-6_MGM]|uniref:hypothetical protein n=1 Tax=Halorubrum sp. GN11_10-6_MGM TaxID=2518112 RepID=UPI0010F63ED2|nr:hypothetical protein [Halorubrum sp. GN11_10-6_MGM]TKX74665.1 hypothetical protein EXE46_08175 [Halorubrum sp. GN11_10-6_MGM]
MNRAAVVVALLAVVGVALVLSGFVGGATEEPAVDDVADDRLIEVDGDYRLWPYTSRTTTVEGRTLAINVVFHADAAATRAAIEGDSVADWEETDPDEAAATVGDGDHLREFVARDWRDAHSSLRYSYVAGPSGGAWLTETFELHDGSYLGIRDHLRAYESPDGAYTAIQAHEEYYDWFRLRHTVPDIDAPATRLEGEFVESDRATDVRREYRGIDGGRSDGWLSVIELAATAALAGALLRSRTREAAVDLLRRLRADAGRHAAAAALGLALGAVVVGVRVAGVTLEAALPGVSPKSIAAPLYLVLGLGVPALVVRRAPRSDPAAASVAVVVGLGAGFVADFAALGAAVPPDLIVHRVALLGALGVVAIGRATADRPVAAVGLLAWAIGLVLPLADAI